MRVLVGVALALGIGVEGAEELEGSDGNGTVHWLACARRCSGATGIGVGIESLALRLLVGVGLAVLASGYTFSECGWVALADVDGICINVSERVGRGDGGGDSCVDIA